MSDKVTMLCGIPIEDLLAIAKIINCNPNLLEEIKSGYSFGYEKGYEDAMNAINEAICREIAKPIYDSAGTLSIPKIKMEPYKSPKLDISALYRYGHPITEAKGIMVAIKTEKTEEEKK